MWVVGAHSLPTLFGLVFVVAVAIFGAKTRAYPTLSLALLTSLLTVVLRLYRVRHSSVDTDNSYHDRGGALPLPAFVAKPALTLVMSTFNIVALASPAELRGLPQGSVVLAEAGSPAWNISYRMAVPTLLSSLNGWSLRAHTLRHPVGFAWPHYVELAAAQATLSRVVQTVWAQHEVWAQAHGQLADGQVFCVPGVTALSAVRSVPFVSPVETPLFRPMPTVSGNLVKVQAELTKAQPSAALCFVQPERA